MTGHTYKITHIPSGKFYLGSSNNCNRRLSEHLDSLKLKTHNYKFQNTWKSSADITSYKLEILQKCNNRTAAYIEEQLLLNKYISDKNCLNVSANCLPGIKTKKSIQLTEANKDEYYQKLINSKWWLKQKKSKSQKKRHHKILKSARNKYYRNKKAKQIQRMKQKYPQWELDKKIREQQANWSQKQPSKIN